MSEHVRSFLFWRLFYVDTIYESKFIPTTAFLDRPAKSYTWILHTDRAIGCPSCFGSRKICRKKLPSYNMNINQASSLLCQILTLDFILVIIINRSEKYIFTVPIEKIGMKGQIWRRETKNAAYYSGWFLFKGGGGIGRRTRQRGVRVEDFLPNLIFKRPIMQAFQANHSVEVSCRKSPSGIDPRTSPALYVTIRSSKSAWRLLFAIGRIWFQKFADSHLRSLPFSD